MAHGIEGISNDLLFQAGYVKAREPTYERMLVLLEQAVRGAFGAGLATVWRDRDFHAVYDRPLLLLAALRYDALCEGSTHPLSAALVQQPAAVEAVTRDALALAVAPERTRFWRALEERAVQTNETTRAVAWLWPAHLLCGAGETRALALVDLGTSAGLNLIADELPALWSDEQGQPLAVEPRAQVALRLGLDIAPLDVRDEDAATWLRACVWPSDAQRLARLEQGITRFRASGGRADAPRLEGCALPDAPARLDALPSDVFVLCVQSIVRDYLASEDRERYERGMRDFLLRRPPRSTLWVELEVAPDVASVAAERSAQLTFRFHAGGTLCELPMARTHPHPKQLFIDAASVSAFETAWRDRTRD